jgi:hypothetical protein
MERQSESLLYALREQPPGQMVAPTPVVLGAQRMSFTMAYIFGSYALGEIVRIIIHDS